MPWPDHDRGLLRKRPLLAAFYGVRVFWCSRTERTLTIHHDRGLLRKRPLPAAFFGVRERRCPVNSTVAWACYASAPPGRVSASTGGPGCLSIWVAEGHKRDGGGTCSRQYPNRAAHVSTVAWALPRKWPRAATISRHICWDSRVAQVARQPGWPKATRGTVLALAKSRA